MRDAMPLSRERTLSVRIGRLLPAALLLAACARPYTKQVDTVTRLDTGRISSKRIAGAEVAQEPSASSPVLALRINEEIRAPQQKAGVFQTYTQEWGSERNTMYWKDGQPDTTGQFLNVLNFPTFSAFYLVSGVVALGLEPMSPCAARHLMAVARNVLLTFLSETSATVNCKQPVGSRQTGKWSDAGFETSARRPFAHGAVAMLVDGKEAKRYETDGDGRLDIDLADDVMGLYQDAPRSVAISLNSPADAKFQKDVSISDPSVLQALHRRHRARELAAKAEASLQAEDLPDAIRRYEEAAAVDPGLPGVSAKLEELRSQAKAEGPTRWARSLALSRIANTPQESRDALAAGRIAWEKNALSAEGFGLDASASAWTNVERAAAELLNLDTAKYSGASLPVAPKLVQGEYEPAAVFSGRVAQEKKKYEEALAAYEGKLAAYPAWRRNAVVQAAVNLVLGSPKVAKMHDYDANSQIFSPQVVSESPFAKDFRQIFLLSEAIPYDQAPDFDPALQASSPRVTFERRGTKLALASAEFSVQGKAYAGLPAKEGAGAAQSLASVDLGAAQRRAAESAFSVQYSQSSENPEIASKLAELEKLKKENSAKTELKALEAQIAELKRGQGRAVKSDVDQPAFAAKSRRPDDLAVVIGIESYHDSNLPKADYAQRDAEAVSAYLERLGVPAGNIVRLTGDAATAGRIKGYLESWLPKNAKPGSRVYFYFSGHGAPDPATHDAYLLSWDGDPNLLRTTAVSLNEIYADLGKLPAQQVLVAMDSCFSGASGRSVMKKGARPLVLVRMEENLSPNLTVLAAAQNDEIANSMEGEGHGMFTYYLLKGLGRAAARDSAKALALCDELKSEVKAAAARENGQQVPLCRGADFDLW